MDRDDWLAQVNEEIVDPELPICDPHHHLWDHPQSQYLLTQLLEDTNRRSQHRVHRLHGMWINVPRRRSGCLKACR